MYEPGMPLMDSQEDWDCLYMEVFDDLNFFKGNNYYHIRKNSNEALYDLIHFNKRDFVFIDGLHTYEQLKLDLENYSKLIRKGGIIACHDYNHPTFPDLTIAIDEFVAKHKANLVICPLHMVYFEKNW